MKTGALPVPTDQHGWAIFDGMLEGVQIIDFDHRYLYVNEAAVVQNKISREELIGYTQIEKYPGIEKTEIFAKMHTCLKERIAQISENPFVFPDGSMGWYEIRVEPITEGAIIFSLNINFIPISFK